MEAVYVRHTVFSEKNIFRLILFMTFVNFIAAIYNTKLGVVSSAISIAGLVGSIFVV